MLDDTDRRLLRQLQNTPDATLSALATRAGVSTQLATRRFEKLRASGVLRGQRAVIDWRALGYAVEVSLRFTLDKTDPRAFDAFLDAARQVPEVIEIQTFLGRVDVRLNVVARDLQDYHRLYRTRILSLPHIAECEALMQVATLKRDERLPL
ncbi:Leucine-responsive regulatory protein [Rhodobacteraceae bacterium THAF1]|uniref:Lrp/AsnC family transcriptional regulator n=1 Tax=Palleronia sp. THAF1 TaxID=2587842 RepID=UPI000F3BA639|nr:Lrp/AsnC family transcriptional regulator [Palleronia sp. THAF1]QFU07522.1 Leucine-responsive regulatory protein [Palleronia sp. THAF1]VDC20485.1 Leucine-responsive regulatory protein [Rhodobacteraceae bacterium THAF1]